MRRDLLIGVSLIVIGLDSCPIVFAASESMPLPTQLLGMISYSRYCYTKLVSNLLVANAISKHRPDSIRLRTVIFYHTRI